MEKTISENKLVEHEIPFVLRDLEMEFNSHTRERNSLEKLKYWQIIITTVLITLIMGNKDFTPFIVILLSFITLFINVIIAYLEVGYRWHINLIEGNTYEKEKKLKTKILEEFEENIIDWKFGTGRTFNHYYKNRREIFELIICKRYFILWYLFFGFLSLLPIIIIIIN